MSTTQDVLLALVRFRRLTVLLLGSVEAITLYSHNCQFDRTSVGSPHVAQAACCRSSLFVPSLIHSFPPHTHSRASLKRVSASSGSYKTTRCDLVRPPPPLVSHLFPSDLIPSDQQTPSWPPRPSDYVITCTWLDAALAS
ncbi:unnamed protein product [Protopolystoma xenopodis]|uniref:Uncharacterized protein n=1 Tax=Protopolystoma xenopodis TaxID=117903 RepID=A0A3S5CR23_9PLAT|nr:unnamed protein product [Protopolystoma xenopodis]